MRKITALLLVVVLVIGLFAGCSGLKTEPAGDKENKTETGKTTDVPDIAFEGKGTAEEPYQITSADELKAFADLINSSAGNAAVIGASYMLMNDVDLGNQEWEPIGDSYLESYYSFTGTFDGAGHTISGLNPVNNAEGTVRYFGLFGLVEGTVKNVVIDASAIDCSAKDSAKTGAVAGRIDFGGVIENCRVTSAVTVKGSYTTGGVVGEMAGTMLNCTNEAAVTGTSDVGHTGGLAGTVTRFDEKDKGIELGCNRGAVQSAGIAGGVAGALQEGTVNRAANEGAVSGAIAGGVVGSVNAAETDGSVSDYIISDCSNAGAVTGSKLAGGIVAEATITTGNVSISGGQNTGAVLANVMGGILGAAHTSTSSAALTVSSCMNTAVLENAGADGTAEVGGIVASITAKTGGTFNLTDNQNLVAIDAGTGRAGGILGTYLSTLSEDSSTTAALNIANCTQMGSVSGGAMGVGGIVGEISAASYPALTLNITNCLSESDLFGRTANVRIGGIVGVIEPHHVTAAFTNCTHNGLITCEAVEITEGEEWFDFSAAMGGILGYAGVNGVSVDPADDCGAGSVTALVFEGCTHTGSITTVNEKVQYYTGDIFGLNVAGFEVR